MILKKSVSVVQIGCGSPWLSDFLQGTGIRYSGSKAFRSELVELVDDDGALDVPFILR